MAKKKVQKKTQTKNISKRPARKAVSKKKTPTTPTRRAKTSITDTLDAMSTQEIRAQLHARSRRVRSLERRRDRLMEQIARLDAELMDHGGRVPGAPGGKRPRNDSNLGDALVAALKGKKMRVPEAARAVIDAGYLTTSANFRVIVNQKLISDKRFKKVERGVYTA